MTEDLESAERPCPNDVTHTSPTESPELWACAFRDTMDTENKMDCVLMVTRTTNDPRASQEIALEPASDTSSLLCKGN